MAGIIRIWKDIKNFLGPFSHEEQKPQRLSLTMCAGNRNATINLKWFMVSWIFTYVPFNWGDESVKLPLKAALTNASQCQNYSYLLAKWHWAKGRKKWMHKLHSDVSWDWEVLFETCIETLYPVSYSNLASKLSFLSPGAHLQSYCTTNRIN